MNYKIIEEPVNVWNEIKDSNNITLLEKFYGNQEKYAFPFQMLAYITRLSLVKSAIKGSSHYSNNNKTFIFSVEGNIGSGKTTLVRHLQDYFNKHNNNNADYNVIITERSVYTDCNVFAQMLHDNNKINEIEYAIYKSWFNEFLQDLPQTAFIYIKSDPIVAHTRVKKRARDGEGVISIEYLENCHKYHEDWLKNIKQENLLVINVNDDINENPNIMHIWINKIESYIRTFY